MPATEQRARRAVILLIDDDHGDQELTRRALAADVVRTDLRVVNDGEEALNYLYRKAEFAAPDVSPTPDLILLDLNMPNLDGREVLKRLKADTRLNSIPVVILTTSEQEIDILNTYKLGCNSYITKPVELGGFLAAIRDLGAYWFELVTLPKSDR